MRALLAVVVLLASGSGAAARPSPSAQEAFDSGLTLMAQRDYERACAAFDVSQRLDPQYGTMLNLAICYVMVGKLYAGWKLYCDVARGDHDRRRAARAARAAEELWPRLARLRFRSRTDPSGQDQTAGLRVRLDDSDVTSLLDTDIPIEDGDHRIDAELPGKRAFYQTVNLAAGEIRAVDLVFEAEPAPAAPPPPAPEPARVRTPAPSPPPIASSPRTTWAWIAIGGGSALVAGGLAAGWRAHGLADQAHAACQLGQCADPDAARRLIDRARGWGDVATITVLIGAAAIGGSVYWLHSARDHGVRVAIAAAPGAGSLAVGGAF